MEILNKQINNFICVFCKSIKLTEVINFGEVALAGAFLKEKEFSNEKKYPLSLVFCNECYIVQVSDHVDPTVLFKTDFYFSSAIKTLQDHFSDYAKEVTDRFLIDKKNSITLEFGSNDGVLLKPVKECGVGTVIGVDPATNIVESIENNDLVLINNFFTTSIAKDVVSNYGQVDIIMANNVFAHISDINGTTEAIDTALSDDGVFIFEVHYLGKIIEDMQYDFIYHEHIYYYSLLALKNHFERHNMVIFDLKLINIHGGSMRYYVAKKTSKHAQYISKNVHDLKSKELSLGYDKPQAYINFSKKVQEKKIELMDIIKKLTNEGKTIAGYGASGRANTIIQYCGITKNDVGYIVDDGPAKQGLYTPGSHIPIKINEYLQENPPDYILIFAWAFYAEIIKKCEDFCNNGGKIIVPLPKVKVL